MFLNAVIETAGTVFSFAAPGISCGIAVGSIVPGVQIYYKNKENQAAMAVAGGLGVGGLVQAMRDNAAMLIPIPHMLDAPLMGAVTGWATYSLWRYGLKKYIS